MGHEGPESTGSAVWGREGLIEKGYREGHREKGTYRKKYSDIYMKMSK